MTRWIAFVLFLEVSVPLLSASAARVPGPRAETCAEIPAGLAGWWTFDPPEDLADRSSYGARGRANDEVERVDGKVGAAAEIGPTGRFVVDHHPGLVLSESFTVEHWIRTADSLGARAIARKTADASGRIQGFVVRLVDGRPEIELAAESSARFRAQAFVADGRWHHLAVSADRADSAGIRFYVDGDPTPPGGPAPAQGTLDNLAALVIGFAPGFEPAARAVVDEPSIYSRALLRTEIVAIWAAGADGKCRDG